MSDEEPVTENEQRAKMFDQMAARLRLNHDAKFGGAFLLIPPDSTPEQWQHLMLIGMEQPGIFWSAVQTISKIAIDETDRLNRQYGR